MVAIVGLSAGCLKIKQAGTWALRPGS